jgi:hypothetical protein
VSGRTVVVHYHFFKNAGTSVDATLRENFGNGWVARERPPMGRLLSEAVGKIIEDDPEIVVLSSHTALMPPPDVPVCTIVPIVFVRHPLDRLRSIYEFERRQTEETLGATMAKRLDIAGYLGWRLERSQKADATAASFQTTRLAGFRVSPTERLSRALDRIDELPFVGLVEEFEASIEALQRLLVQYFPSVRLRPMWENASDRRISLEERIGRLRASIPDDLYERLVISNADDLAVWERVMDRYQAAR